MLLFVLVIFFVLYMYVIPKYNLGNIFFGDIPVLYNTEFAQFFYKQSLLFDTKDGLPPPFAHHQLSRVHFVKGELFLALYHCNQELEFYPDHVNAYYIQGLTLGYMNRERDAIQSFEKFLEYIPDSWAAMNDKAWLHFRLGEIDEALATIIPAAQTDPHNPWVLNTVGVLLLNKKSYTEAQNAFSHAIEITNEMSPDEWGRAYPGNSPRIYETGLDAMKVMLRSNLVLASSYTQVGE